MTPAEVTERAIAEVLAAALPARLRGDVGAHSVKESVLEFLVCYDEESALFPGEVLLPWSNWIGYDDDWDEAFFVVMILREATIELFCGTGVWPDVRHFGEGDADDIPLSDWHREWSARFAVPCPALVLGKATVKEWLGRDW